MEPCVALYQGRGRRLGAPWARQKSTWRTAHRTSASSQHGEVQRLRRLADAAEPADSYDEFWPEFSRFELEPGDRLLLLTPALADVLPPEEPGASFKLPADEVLPSIYHHARSLPDCGAVLIAALDSPVLPSLQDSSLNSDI